jgi:hypothetical protein
MLRPIEPGDRNKPEHLEARLQAAARQFSYPPTPDLVTSLRGHLDSVRPQPRLVWRRSARLGLIAAVLLAALLAVPGVRAALLDFIRVGAVRIYLTPPTATPTPAPAAPALIETRPAVEAPITATPAPLSGAQRPPTVSLADLAGQTTLESARARAGFPVLLPAYPPDLGAPDRVYLQNLGGRLLVLVWLDPYNPGGVRLSLHTLTSDVDAFKLAPAVVAETQVSGRRAIWTQGPYLLLLKRSGGDQITPGRMIEGHVLIWTLADLTYRLETDLPLDEAVKIAESLR